MPAPPGARTNKPPAVFSQQGVSPGRGVSTAVPAPPSSAPSGIPRAVLNGPRPRFTSASERQLEARLYLPPDGTAVGTSSTIPLPSTTPSVSPSGTRPRRSVSPRALELRPRPDSALQPASPTGIADPAGQGTLLAAPRHSPRRSLLAENELDEALAVSSAFSGSFARRPKEAVPAERHQQTPPPASADLSPSASPRLQLEPPHSSATAAAAAPALPVQSDAVLARWEALFAESDERRTTRAADQARLQQSMAAVGQRVKTLDQTFAPPQAGGGTGGFTSGGLGQRYRLGSAADAERTLDELLEIPFLTEPSARRVGRGPNAVIDPAAAQKIGHLGNLTGGMAVEIEALKKKLGTQVQDFASVEARNVELEAEAQHHVLKIAALEQLVVKLKRNGGSSSGGSGPAAVSDKLLSRRRTRVPATAAANGNGADEARRAIATARSRAIVSSDRLVEVEALGLEGDDGPKGACIALVVTHVQGAAALWDQNPILMRRTLEVHHDVLRLTLAEFEGYEFKSCGDVFMLAFRGPLGAVEFALTLQTRLLQALWSEEWDSIPHSATVHLTGAQQSLPYLFKGIRVGVAVHCGAPFCLTDPLTGRTDYQGPVMNHCLQIDHLTPGGTVTISDAVFKDASVAAFLSTPQGGEMGSGLPAAILPLGRTQLVGSAEASMLLHRIVPTALRARLSLTATASDLLLADQHGRIISATRDQGKRLSGIVGAACVRAEGADLLRVAVGEATFNETMAVFRDAVARQGAFFDGSVALDDGTDKLLILFSDARLAFRFAIRLQSALMDAEWPERLLALWLPAGEEKSADGTVLFRGLRAQIGLHECDVVPVSAASDGDLDDFGSGIGKAVLDKDGSGVLPPAQPAALAAANAAVRYAGEELHIAVALSQAAQGGETLLSAAVHGRIADRLHLCDRANVKPYGRRVRLPYASAGAFGRESMMSGQANSMQPQEVTTFMAFPERLATRGHALLAHDTHRRRVPTGTSPRDMGWSMTMGSTLRGGASTLLEAGDEAHIRSMVVRAPFGVITLVAIDIAGIASLWEHDEAVITASLQTMRRKLQGIAATTNGYEVHADGDAALLAFQNAVDAAQFALLLQEALASTPWPSALTALPAARLQMKANKGGPLWNGLQIRVGIHTGVPQAHLDASTKRCVYYGRAVHHVARLVSVAVGGQIVASDAAFEKLSPYLARLGHPVVEPLSSDFSEVACESPGNAQRLPPARKVSGGALGVPPLSPTALSNAASEGTLSPGGASLPSTGKGGKKKSVAPPLKSPIGEPLAEGSDSPGSLTVANAVSRSPSMRKPGSVDGMDATAITPPAVPALVSDPRRLWSLCPASLEERTFANLERSKGKDSSVASDASPAFSLEATIKNAAARSGNLSRIDSGVGPASPNNHKRSALDALVRATTTKGAALTAAARGVSGPASSLAAPHGAVAIMFTAVDGALELWQNFPHAMVECVKLLAVATRDTLPKYNGYEARCDNDAFMLVFPTCQDAVAYALHLQEALMALDWPREILASELALAVPVPSGTVGAKSNSVLFRGLRVRTSIDWGTPHTEVDSTSGRVQYMGPAVYRAAHVGSWGHGGQTIVTKVVRDAVMADPTAFAQSHGVKPTVLPLGTRKTRRIVSGRGVEGSPAALSPHAPTHTNPQQHQQQPPPSPRASKGGGTAATAAVTVAARALGAALKPPLNKGTSAAAASPPASLRLVVPRAVGAAHSPAPPAAIRRQSSVAEFFPSPHSASEGGGHHAHHVVEPVELFLISGAGTVVAARTFPALRADDDAREERFQELEARHQRQEAERQAAPAAAEVVFVFTNVEGSTALWEKNDTVMAAAHKVHHETMRRAIAMHHGYEVKTDSDAFMIAFHTCADAVRCCLFAQMALARAPWPAGLAALGPQVAELFDEDGGTLWRGLRVGMGIHVGPCDHDADPTSGRVDYFGTTVNKAAHVAAKAVGGEIVCSDDVLCRIESLQLIGFPVVSALGSFLLKGIDKPADLYQVTSIEFGGRDFAPNRTPDGTNGALFGGRPPTPPGGLWWERPLPAGGGGDSNHPTPHHGAGGSDDDTIDDLLAKLATAPPDSDGAAATREALKKRWTALRKRERVSRLRVAESERRAEALEQDLREQEAAAAAVRGELLASHTRVRHFHALMKAFLAFQAEASPLAMTGMGAGAAGGNADALAQSAMLDMSNPNLKVLSEDDFVFRWVGVVRESARRRDGRSPSVSAAALRSLSGAAANNLKDEFVHVMRAAAETETDEARLIAGGGAAAAQLLLRSSAGLLAKTFVAVNKYVKRTQKEAKEQAKVGHLLATSVSTFSTENALRASALATAAGAGSRRPSVAAASKRLSTFASSPTTTGGDAGFAPVTSPRAGTTAAAFGGGGSRPGSPAKGGEHAVGGLASSGSAASLLAATAPRPHLQHGTEGNDGGGIDSPNASLPLFAAGYEATHVFRADLDFGGGEVEAFGMPQAERAEPNPGRGGRDGSAPPRPSIPGRRVSFAR